MYYSHSPIPLEPAKRMQSHSSCFGGWSGANSTCMYNFWIKPKRKMLKVNYRNDSGAFLMNKAGTPTMC